ncbi:TRAP transporter small permease subunit [Allopusillimonas soli]|uniref:TRAP transporter small permease protein n=1 Tax=Allopusillimonas soli TaxID=659016 RepID=A0A853F884_9BURK|nr:TRAP transporter small permease subunit [Allopusillimonas soli]NYT35762.1 TRAP transporter small permease subunit [Allopusillimonas soli]TEA76143.1 TRAP transporter small permease subunit [Allopusillimonas soli]
MKAFLALSRLIDSVNSVVGRAAAWLILVAVVVSAANALIRKLFSMSSNAWLELQWYLFGAVFLLTAGYTLLRNEHVRVDVLSQHFSPRTRIKIEIFGVLLFILPAAIVIMWLSWPIFVDAFIHNEQSSNAGGLIRWPAKLLIPVGFALLVAAAVSHLIKCVAYLLGLCADPTQVADSESSELQLADEISRIATQSERASPRGKS